MISRSCFAFVVGRAADCNREGPLWGKPCSPLPYGPFLSRSPIAAYSTWRSLLWIQGSDVFVVCSQACWLCLCPYSQWRVETCCWLLKIWYWEQTVGWVNFIIIRKVSISTIRIIFFDRFYCRCGLTINSVYFPRIIGGVWLWIRALESFYDASFSPSVGGIWNLSLTLLTRGSPLDCQNLLATPIFHEHPTLTEWKRRPACAENPSILCH